MQPPTHIRTFIISALGILLLAACARPASSQNKSGQILVKDGKFGGLTVTYKVILPEGFDKNKTYPGVLALPPGPQTMSMVDGMIARNLNRESAQRGYITVIPAAPAAGLFFQGGEAAFPDFLDQILKDYHIRDDKFHVIGISNGGISAFHIAARYPQYFLTIIGMPGYLNDSGKYMSAMKGKCIHMYVGENDSGWRDAMEAEAKQFQDAGISTTFSIEPDQGHVMRTLQDKGAARIFDHLDAEPNGCPQ